MKVKTGLPGLDIMLKGGLPKGRTILLSGHSGSGKTIMAIQYLHAAMLNDKEKSLYVTLEESKEKVIEDMEKIGIDLRKAQKSGRFIILGGPISQLTSSMKKINADVHNLIEEIEEIITTNHITRVAIDSINLITMLLKNDEERREMLALLSNILSSLGCTSLLLSEIEEGTMTLSRYGVEEFIVDGVIALYLQRQDARFVPGIAVRKMRGCDHDREIRAYTLTKNGVTIYPNETMFTDN